LIAAACILIAGDSDGTTWLERTAVGVGIVLLAKGIMARNGSPSAATRRPHRRTP